MKNSIVKRIAVLAATAVLGLSMAACGNTAKETAAPEETAVAEAAAPAETPASVETAEPAPEPAAEPAPETTEAPAALTEEEYLTTASELLTTISDSLSVVEEGVDQFDDSDVEGLTAYTEGLKVPFQEFAALAAPEKYAATQAKFKSGCEAMIEYFDVCIQYTDPDLSTEDDEKLTARLSELLVTVETDLSEAITMLSEASGVALE